MAPMHPPGYPAHLERTIALGDGRRVHVRPIVPSDAGDLQAAAAAADDETLYMRFFTTRPRLSDSQLRHLTELDYRSRLALVARDDAGQGVAVARYESLADSDAAEVAVVVDPGWRRVGLAAVLLGMLEDAAREAGVTRLVAHHLVDNQPAAAMLAAAGYGAPTVSDGVATVGRALHPVAPS